MWYLIHSLVGVMLIIFVYGMYKFVQVYTIGYKDDNDEFIVMPHRRKFMEESAFLDELIEESIRLDKEEKTNY